MTTLSTRDLMSTAAVIPVLVIDDPGTAEPLARALVSGGLPVLEVTLRTPAALEAVSEMLKVEGAIVGIGTALSADDLKAAADRGARFAVSPGYTPELGRAAQALSMPLLPGVATSADIMRARADGYTAVKFFPAEQAGGANMLKAFAGPFHDTVFCPTGGIGLHNAADYLNLANVVCVGGSWVAPRELVARADWAGITELAAAAARLALPANAVTC